MKVLMINATYGGVSGSGRAVRLLSEELLRRGLEIELFTEKTVGCLKVPKLKSLSFAVLARLKEKREYDVIHVHSPKFSESVSTRLGNVLTIHGDFLTEFQWLYGRTMAKLFDRWFRGQQRKFNVITCVSPYWSILRGWRYVPNGLDLERISKIPPSHERFVLFVGRKNRIKGYDLFRDAVRGTSYPYKMLGVDQIVSWEEVISYMKSAYCLVLPSKQEGMPYVILEAFACGCPVVATDLPPLRSFGDGAIEFLETANVECTRKAINEVVEDQTLAQRLKNRGLERAKEYDIKKVAEQYLAVYREAIDGSLP
jgi:glycosyltransferase involved in cell wall biosynthesis